MTDETLKQLSDRDLLLKIFDRFDSLEIRLDAHDAQFEAIRSGLVANHSEFSRFTAKVLNMSADLNNLTEEVRKDRLALK